MELRYLSLLGLILLSAYSVNADNGIESASGILSSIYDECLPKLSYSCLQKKVLVFVDRLDSVRSFSLADGWDIIKRPAADGARSAGLEDPPAITEEDLKTLGEGRAADGAEEILHDMLDNRIVSFFEHRALKISFPSEIAAVVTGRSGAGKVPSMEISLEEDASEGRLKKKKKLKLKALLLGVLLLGGIKLIKLMPVLLALIKLKAIKALIFATISLFITLGGAARGLIQRKLALFTSPMKHVKTVEVWLAPMKGGHGGGDAHGSYSSGSNSYSSGGGGGGGGGSYHGGSSGADSYSPNYNSGADSYSSGSGHQSSGSYSDSYSVGGGSYNSGGGHGGGGWSSKSDATQDAHNLAYRAHTTV